MKHYFLLLVLIGITAQVNSQKTINDKLPEKLYGEWYQKVGQREYNGMLIRPDFIEFFYQACSYIKIEDRDSLYSISAMLNNGDTASFSIQFITDDTIKVVRPGGDIAVYGKVECPPNGTRINPEDLPKNLRKTWYTTDGKNSLEFDLTNNKFFFKNSEYTSEDVILYNDWWGIQYRIIGKNSEGKAMMFYFKNWNDGYVQVGYSGRNGDYYKSSVEYINYKCDNPQNITKDFGGSWFSTNGKDRKEFELKNGNFKINSKEYSIFQMQKKQDRYFFLLSHNKTITPFYIQKETDDYLLFSKGNKSPELLKHSIKDKNYLTLKLPGSIIGKWYSTDGKNKECVSISPDEVVLWGKKIKDPVFGKTTNGLGIMTNREKFAAVVTFKTPTHIEVLNKKGERIILKKTPDADNTMYISTEQLPENLKDNWFGTDSTEYWAFGITDNFFVADNAFWNYLDIAYKSNTYTITVENDNGVNNYIFKPIDTETCEVSKNSGSFKTYTKDRSKAVYKPQNKFSSRKTKDVFIQGYVSDMTKETPRTINFLVNNIVFDTQVTYPAKIDKDGRFEITIPKLYGQDIFLKHVGFITLFVSPGDSILMQFDANDINNSILFMGDDADACFDIMNFRQNRNKVFSSEPYKERRNRIITDTCFVYKEFQKKQHEKELKNLENYISNYVLSDNLTAWLKNDVKYNYPQELMRYTWLRPMYKKMRTGKINIPESYFSFINDYPVSLNRDIISSSFQGYCHELIIYFSKKMYEDPVTWIPLNTEDFYKYLKDNNIEVSENIKIAIDKKYNKKKLSKEDQKIISDFYNKYKKQVILFSRTKGFNIEKKYFKKRKISDLYQLNISSRLYRTIDQLDTTTLKSIFPTYMSQLNDTNFKQILRAKYDEVIAAARNPFIIKDAILTKENPTSGDSLLVNIVNKHKGKVIYVDFWATWCGPCRGEMPNSLKIQEKLKGKDVAFVYLCSDSSPETKWKQLINQLEITGDHYYVNRAAWSDLTGRFGITGIPHYVLIDKEGKIVNKAAKRPSQGDALVKDIEDLLKK